MDKTAVKRRSNGQFVKGNKEGVKFKPNNNANPNGRNGAMSDLFKELAEAKDEQGKTRKEKILDKILKDGAEKADKITSKKVKEMKKIVGF